MKKALFVLLSVITLIFAGCQTITVKSGAFSIPSSLEDLVNVKSNSIFIAKVEKVLPAERVKLSEVADVAAENDSFLNFTPVEVKVIKAIKGEAEDDMTLTVSLNGGMAKGVNEIYEGLYELEEGKTYLLFVTGGDTHDKKHSCRLAVPYFPNPQIVEGKLVDYAEEAFHLPSGLTIDETVERILAAAE